MSSLYERYILPHVIGCACGAPPIRALRAKIVPQATGKVLELGIGGGLNLAFYDAARVSSVTGVDPSEALRAKAAAAPRSAGLRVEILDGLGEALPFDDASFDTAVCTFTLCSVDSPEAALLEARRVLKPGGKLLFSEHGLAPDIGVRRWQYRLEPFWKPFAGGCHLTRSAGALIEAAGFRLGDLDGKYLRSLPRFLGWSECGMALRD